MFGYPVKKSYQNTNSSQLFITTSPQPQLDGENVVFGNVIEGIDIVTVQDLALYTS